MVDNIGISFLPARRLIGMAVLTAMLAIALPGGSAWAAEAPVDVFNFGYNPQTVRVKPGDSVRWTFTEGTHTVTDTTGLEGWSSGVMTTGEEFSRFFWASGRYTYRCDIHPNAMVGTVTVLMKARPTTDGKILVTWAEEAPDVGTHFDVLIQRPTDDSFVPWRTEVTRTSATIAPPPGTYLFKARVQSDSNPLIASGFSPAKKVIVSAPA